ncbi:hypothetical protein HDC92_003810 [Pedobacter sp. AK017]|nr:hypothetical protein [Pedobacter sp. AK017]
MGQVCASYEQNTQQAEARQILGIDMSYPFIAIQVNELISIWLYTQYFYFYLSYTP